MSGYKTVPNQKTVKVSKVETKGKIFAQIEMNALEEAARNLKAGAFKLWVYFSKNQNNYEFGLSSSDALATFGMKKDQYDGAVKELIEKGYLVQSSGNSYTFYEVVGKNHNDKNSVVGKNHNDVVGKNHNQLQEKTTTGCSKNPQEIIQDNIHNTINNTENDSSPGDGFYNPIVVSKEWMMENYNQHEWTAYPTAKRWQHNPSGKYYTVK